MVKQQEGEIAKPSGQEAVNGTRGWRTWRRLLADQQGWAQWVLVLIIPFLKTLFFGVGAMVSLGFAFRQGKRPGCRKTINCRVRSSRLPQLPTRQTSFPSSVELPEPLNQTSKGKRRNPVVPENVIGFPTEPSRRHGSEIGRRIALG